jgi:hypothetical protein
MLNPVLVIIILFVGFMAWLILSNIFKDVGTFFGNLIDSAKKEMEDEKDE